MDIPNNYKKKSSHLIIFVCTLTIVVSIILLVQNYLRSKMQSQLDTQLIIASMFALVLCVVLAIWQYFQIINHEMTENKKYSSGQNNHPLHKKMRILDHAHEQEYISHKAFHSGKRKIQEEIKRQNKKG